MRPVVGSVRSHVILAPLGHETPTSKRVFGCASSFPCSLLLQIERKLTHSTGLFNQPVHTWYGYILCLWVFEEEQIRR